MNLVINGRLITRDTEGKGYYAHGAVAYEGSKIVEVGEAVSYTHLDVYKRQGVGEGPPHIVVLPLPGLHQLLELGNDLLPAAVSCIVHPVAVMDLSLIHI